MASATNLKPSQIALGDAAIAYGKRINIVVPGADQTDAAVGASGAVNTAASTRETERSSGGGGIGGTPFNPDAADYTAKGSERSAP